MREKQPSTLGMTTSFLVAQLLAGCGAVQPPSVAGNEPAPAVSDNEPVRTVETQPINPEQGYDAAKRTYNACERGNFNAMYEIVRDRAAVELLTRICPTHVQAEITKLPDSKERPTTTTISGDLRVIESGQKGEFTCVTTKEAIGGTTCD